jgi:RNA polymerase sigma-70 factor (ECF subfamily)
MDGVFRLDRSPTNLRAGNRTQRQPGEPDRGAFDTASIAHFGSLYRTALRLTKNTADAEDLTQETYARALRASGQFQWGTNLKAWLFTILRNAHRNRRRDAGRAIVIIDNQAVTASDACDEAAKTPEAQLLRDVLDSDLQAALESLPRALRDTVWLREIDELSYAEIAQRLEIPVGTVMSRLAHARELLYRNLTKRPGAFRGRRR